MENNSLRLLQYQEIDLERWDSTIKQAKNGRIYALSWYLNYMAPGWKALISDNYSIVMPLPVRRKFGLEYVYQPAFIQQLGLFTLSDNPIENIDDFLQLISQNFYYAEINANSANYAASYTSSIRKNYLLSLDSDYEAIVKGYSRSAKRNISKALKSNVTVYTSNDPGLLLQLHKQRYGTSLATNADYTAFVEALRMATEKQIAYFFYAKSNAGDTIASSGYLVFKNRVVFIINGNTSESFANGSAHLLKDYAIRFFSKKGLTMDFEGSNTSSFARFYEQYGATATDNYPFIKLNRLPRILRWLKP